MASGGKCIHAGQMGSDSPHFENKRVQNGQEVVKQLNLSYLYNLLKKIELNTVKKKKDLNRNHEPKRDDEKTVRKQFPRLKRRNVVQSPGGRRR